MNWAIIAQLIANYGIPLAEKLWQKWSTGGAPTQADWDELRALGSQTMKSQMLLALARAGIDPSSPQGVALMAAVS